VSSGTTANTTTSGTGTITDNDGNGPTISIADVTVAEGDDAVFYVTTDQVSFEDIVVDITFADGTATNPADYRDGTPLQVTIPAGSTTSEGITFPTINDTAFEDDETFIVVGTVVAGTTSNATTRGTGTIISNEILAINDINDTFEGQPVSGDVGTNDENPDGPAGSEVYTVLTQPTNGTLVFNPDGTYTYTPNDGFIGEDTFSYEVCDGGSPQACDNADVIIQVLPIASPENTAPIANDDTAITEENTPVDGNVLINDFDPDGDTITVTGNTQPTNGSVTVNPDGTFTYTPEPGFVGEDSFEYTICDDADPSLCATGKVTIEVISDTNNTTVANDDAFFGYTEEEIIGNVLTNDSDPEGDAINVISNTQPANGSVTVDTNGSFTYVSNAGYNGADQFTYTIEDANGAQDTATVYISLEEKSFTISIADGECDGDVPYLVYDIDLNNFAATGPLTITFLDNSGNSLLEYTDLPLTGRVLWPGAEVDANGNPTNWPGWILEDGVWVEGDDGFLDVRPDVNVVFSINPSQTIVVNYPPSDPYCYSGPRLDGLVSTTDVSCFGDANGAIDITTSGGTAPFSFNWSTIDGSGLADGQEDQTGLTAGTYNLVITDAVGIEKEFNIEVAQPEQLELVFTDVVGGSSNFMCSNGTATATVSGGSGNYTYLWSASAGGQTTAVATDLTEGVHSVTVTDSNGCEITQEVTITCNTILAINDINDTFEGQPVSGAVGTNDENPDGPAGSEVYTVLTQPTNGTLVFNPDGTYTYTPNDDFIGEDTFSYEVCDGGSPQACDNADVIIQVLPIGTPDNAAPVANDDTAITETGTPVDGNVLVNDFDPDGDTITVTGNTQPTNGSVTVNPDGTFTYTPEPGFVGEDSFEYTVCDDANPSLCATGTVTIEVIADTDNTTVANDDAFFGYIGEEITGNVLTNDSDPEGDAISVISNTQPANGSVSVDADGSISYIPSVGFSGADQFTYTIEDANGAQDTATVYISVDPSENGGNTILAINDINDTFEGQPVSGDVGTNDENPDGPAGSEVYTVLTQPTNGTLVFNPDGTYTYTPNDDFIGEDTFSYEVCDGGSPQACDNADVIIQVLPIGTPDNAAPVANDDTAITETGTPVDGNVLVNDFDPDGDTITVTGNTQPTNGSVTVNPDGTFTYTPEPGFVGEDSFEYTVCDDADPSLCATGTVTIEVIADTDNTTVANDDAFFGYIGEEITGNVLTNDSDPEGDAISVISNTQPANGSVSVEADGSISYIPSVGFSGADQFTYTIEDANGAQDTATVYISVDPSENGGNTILAINDINDTFEGQPVSGDVGTNDENPDGPAGSEVYTVLTQPTNGTLVFNPDGTYTYTPNDGFIGEDTFSYEVCDGGSPQACDNADVIIQVLPIGTPDNAAPVANDDTAITETGTPVEGNVLVNDFDPDGDTITVTGNTQPTNGSVTVNPDGTFTYTPEPGFVGEDSFEYTVCDDADPSLCATGTVTIEVIADTDNTTVANDDAFFGYIGEEITGNVLTNDSDPEGDAISVISNTQPANGSVSVDADGSVSYIPSVGFSGADQFTYTIEDANGAQDTATVYISVDPSENGGNTILAINDINDTFEGQPVSGDVGTNDENPDGPAGSEVYTVLTQPTNGTLVFNPDGTYTYTPNDGFIGEDTFSYEVCDGGSPQACDNADVVIQVLPMEDERDVNEPPVANDDTVITESGVPATGNVLVNDFDPDGDTITVTGNTQPTNGSVTVNPDGTFAYTPELGFTGEDSFEYTVCDDGAPSECTTGTVTIEVTPDYGNSTVANDDAYFGLVDNTISGNVLDNDFDPEGQSQQVDVNTTPLNGPSNGTLVINPDGSFTYTPNAGFIGTDQFTYQISDTGSPVATDVATVYISVRGSDLEPLVASLSLEKVGVFNDENGDQRPQVGETISYTFTVYNTGEVTITDIVIEDPLVDVTGGPIDLAPGEVDGTTFTATYAITQSDIEQLFVENQALVTGEAPDGEIIEDLSDDPNNSDDVDANGDGEPDDVTITIIPNVLSDEDIVIYNVMTPNGDGLNDIFMIENIDDYPDNKVQIFNRWGVEVYSTEGYSIDNDNVFRGFSDGRATVRRGERLPTGTYYYIIEYADPDTGEVRRKASFLYIN
ncbi:MAG: Ig-like domain-containing protein, partial [Leeuwenhoekiella sp.]